MSNIEYIDRPLNHWFILQVLRKRRGWEWRALLIDVDPDDFVSHRGCPYKSRWLDLGWHKSRAAAWAAAEEMRRKL